MTTPLLDIWQITHLDQSMDVSEGNIYTLPTITRTCGKIKPQECVLSQRLPLVTMIFQEVIKFLIYFFYINTTVD